MRNLVKRYVAAMIRDAKTEEGLTEENFKVTIFMLINVIIKCQMTTEHQTNNHATTIHLQLRGQSV